MSRSANSEHLGDCCPECGKGSSGHYPECAYRPSTATLKETEAPCTKTMPVSYNKELRCYLPAGHAGVHKSKGWTYINQRSEKSR